MARVALSSKHQIVVPLNVREPLGLKHGDRLSVLRVGRTIKVLPIPTLAHLQEQLRGYGSDPQQELAD